ncbi:PREDICTED: mediator of RNA polymerase II transcription subunit 15a-like isoform X4 [Populus euphratica]|uniref:Mediator of RNA polymerase II transcription subunit 15a-like isoform X4 n=1 Tax=Populus euphratica TaxID=75702 RepID=A0AAJ6TFE7_POPEU|nr:PREDICTED: mediator of RNA polymerase II transcription subunit 15a-like isoform X4 [Populus euphratica]
MDANNWRPTIPGGEPVIDMGYWRIQLQPDSRKRIIDKIMETLKRHLLFSGQEGLQELKKIVVRFEEKIYTASTNQSDYLRKISLEMLSMEIRSQNAMPTAPMDPAASHSMPPEVQNQGLFLPILLSTDHSQARQQLVSQNMQNCMASNGVQSYAGLQAALPPVSGVTLTIPNTVVQNPNMQSIPGIQWDKGFPTLCLPILRDKCQIKVMKETYFPEINEMHQRIAARLQQVNCLCNFFRIIWPPMIICNFPTLSFCINLFSSSALPVTVSSALITYTSPQPLPQPCINTEELE